MKRLLIVLLSMLAFALPAQAAFPEKPIRLVVAFAPGSSTDIVARLIGEQLSAALGQPVVVENRPGAGGNIATVGVMNAPADGYTLLFHSVAYSVNPSMFANAGYDALTDLQPVAMAAFTPNLIYVHPDVKANNLAELLALARTSKMAYAHSGNGTTTQLGAELLFRGLAKVDITHVPFQPAAATNAVVSGQVPIASTSMPPAVQFVRTGKVRPIAVTSLKRSPALPDVPTVGETVPGYEFYSWYGVWGPAKLPAEVVTRLNGEVNKALAGDMRERLLSQGLLVGGGSVEDFVKFQRDDMARSQKIITDGNIRAE